MVFNDVIALREQRFRDGLPHLSDSEISRLVTTVAKRTPDRAWLAEVSASVLQSTVRDANTAYRNFFDAKQGRRRGGPVGRPRFRSRRDRRQTMRFTRAARFRITPEGRLRLQGIGEVKVAWSRELPSEPSSVTVIRDAAGRYFASFVCKIEPKAKPELTTQVGLDLGLAPLLTDSDGVKTQAPWFLRNAQRALARAQRRLSRKRPGSANRERARLSLARQHAKVADARADFLHKNRARPAHATARGGIGATASPAPGWGLRGSSNHHCREASGRLQAESPPVTGERRSTARIVG